MSVIEEIAAERARQVNVEGWTPEHDDEHGGGEMAAAASCYAAVAAHAAERGDPDTRGLGGSYMKEWPSSWDESWWKPTTARRDLIKAGALIVAEIERWDRAEAALREAKNGGDWGQSDLQDDSIAKDVRE